MPRPTPEWIGKTDDAPVPSRVKLRVFHRGGKCCQGCGRALFPHDRKICDHRIALVNGGANREANLQTLGACCEPAKTKDDVMMKSEAYESQLRHHGFKPKSGRPIMGSKRSGWKKKISGEVVRRG